MLASSFGSVSSSLRRTSANDRFDEIFTCSTAMVCDAKVACAVVWLMCALHIMGGIEFLNDLFYGISPLPSRFGALFAAGGAGPAYWVFRALIRTLAVGPDEAGFWPVISKPSVTTWTPQFLTLV